MTHRIPIAGPSISELEVAYVADAARTGWYGHANDYINRFEQAFAAHTARRFAVALPSCTSALHLALASLGIVPGDEVIVPDCTWIASSAPIAYVGAVPVFADIDPTTWCLSPRALEAVITPRTKAIIVVDLYGHMPDWNEILEIASRRNIAIIEDAAEAIGSSYLGRPAGSFGACATFSFHGSKTLTTGEGGMLVCDDAALHQRVLKLRDHGRAPGDVMFFNEEVAFKYKMSPVQAALGVAQLERLDQLVAMKRQIFQWYKERLGTSHLLTLNPDFAPVFNSYWMTTAIVSPSLDLTKEVLVAAMKDAGIDVRPFFYPLSMLPPYRTSKEALAASGRNHVAYSVSKSGLNLPSALSLTEADIDVVSNTILRVIKNLKDS